jgi:hypothetical protein
MKSVTGAGRAAQPWNGEERQADNAVRRNFNNVMNNLHTHVIKRSGRDHDKAAEITSTSVHEALPKWTPVDGGSSHCPLVDACAKLKR